MDGPPNIDAAIGEMAQKLDLHYRGLFAESVRDACFKKCITRPGDKMSGAEKACLDSCSQRYADVKELVAASVGPIYEKIHGMN